MLEIAKSAPEGQALRAIIEHYLSPRHANSPGMGCVVSALGPEVARKPLSVRKRIEASRKRIVSGYYHLFQVRREKKK